MSWDIPLFRIYWDEDDVSSVTEVIRSGMSWASGEQIKDFEQNLAEYIGSRYCLTFNSGTSALHAALIAHGIGSGDDVIVPSFTFIATANSPRFVEASPVFADIEDRTFGLDPEDVMEKITSRTKAIIAIHYGGCPCEIGALREIADDHGLILIEDAAEAMGARKDGRSVGTFGDSSAFSFCQNKIITTGEGGAMATDSAQVYEKMKLSRSHGRLETCDYFSTSKPMDYVSLGFNFRMSSITAALGMSQLAKIEKIIAMRRNAAGIYGKSLREKAPEVVVPQVPTDSLHVYQLFSVLAPCRDALMAHLENKGIMSKIYFSPVHQTEYYQKTMKSPCSLPVTERIAQSIISLPIYPGISPREMDCVVEVINNFYEGI